MYKENLRNSMTEKFDKHKEIKINAELTIILVML